MAPYVLAVQVFLHGFGSAGVKENLQSVCHVGSFVVTDPLQFGEEDGV